MHAHPAYFALLVLAAIAFLLAAVTVPVHPRVNLIAVGLLLWVLVPILTLARQ